MKAIDINKIIVMGFCLCLMGCGADSGTKMAEKNSEVSPANPRKIDITAERTNAQTQEYDNGYYTVQYPGRWQRVDDTHIRNIDPLTAVEFEHPNIKTLDSVTFYNMADSRHFVKLSIAQAISYQQRQFNPVANRVLAKYFTSIQQGMSHALGFASFARSNLAKQFQAYDGRHLCVTGRDGTGELKIHLFVIPNNTNDLICTIVYSESEWFNAQDIQSRQDIIDSLILYF